MFERAPRWFGYPKQVYVPCTEAISNLIKVFNGNSPCYLSTYVFPTKKTAIVDNIPFDIDNPKDLKISYEATRRLKEHLDNLGIPNIVVFSGRNGFHVYEFIKPSSDISQCDIRNIQYNQLEMSGVGFRTVDGSPTRSSNLVPAIMSQTLGRFRQLMRIPTTKYVKNNYSNGYYCRYIPDSDFRRGLEHIKHISKEPGEMPPYLTSTFTHKDIWDMLGEERHKLSYFPCEIEYTNGAISSVPLLEVILPLCLRRSIQKSRPSHLTRRETTVYLHFLGFSAEAIVEFYRRLNDNNGVPLWSDWDYETTRYQVYSLKGRFPKCTDLRLDVALPGECEKCAWNIKNDINI